MSTKRTPSIIKRLQNTTDVNEYIEIGRQPYNMAPITVCGQVNKIKETLLFTYKDHTSNASYHIQSKIIGRRLETNFFLILYSDFND